MKTDRFSRSARAAAILLAGLLLAASAPAGAQFRIPIGRGRVISVESSTKEMSVALAQQVREVKKRFKDKRGALRTVPGPGGKPAYLRDDVTGLITATEKDLDQAILDVQKPGLEMDALRAWSANEIERIQRDLAATPVQTAAFFPDLRTPRAVAAVANLGWVSLPRFASAKKAAPAPSRQETLTADRANSLLDQVGEVIGKIFVIGDTDDLEVKLWVGSTPKDKARFQFWPQSGVDAASATTSIETNGKKDHVLRGLYAYRAAWTQGQVTQLIQLSSMAVTSTASLPTDPLDLVKGTPFFCCRFNQEYCGHVAKEKECRQ